MNKIAKNGNKRKFWISLLLVVAIASVAFTMALAVVQTGAVTNTFHAADHSTKIEENVEGELNKDVTVTNTGKSDAFIRVRIVASPSEKVNLIFAPNAFDENTKEGYWIKDKDINSSEIFYYFSKPVASGAKTTKLLDAVQPVDGYKEMFDVTVYEESCVAKPIPNTMTGKDEVLEFIKDRFDESDGTKN